MAPDLLEIELLFIYFGVTNYLAGFDQNSKFAIQRTEGNPGCVC